MKKLLFAAGIFALAAALIPSQASAQGRSGNHGGGTSSHMTTPSSNDRGLYRADVAAGKHGSRGRANARTRGSHAMGFCPPGQAKKYGKGSRFAC